MDNNVLMINNIISEQEQQQLTKAIEVSKNVVVVAHVAPDGDAVGSSLALSGVLRKLGKNVNVVMPDALPKSIMFLQGAADIKIYKEKPEECDSIIANADTLFCLDFNEPKRVDLMQNAILEASAYKIMIDHHINPSDFCDLVISYPQLSSTSLLIYKIIMQLSLDVMVAKAEAEAQATIIAANAEAKANEILANSLSDKILTNIYYQKWDGKLPSVVGSGDYIISPELIK